MRKILLLTLFGASFWMLFSCSQQYDLATVDKTITVGGDNFVFPLGHSTMMIVDSILDFSSIDELKRDEAGNYYFNYSGSLVDTIKLGSFADSMKITCDSYHFQSQTCTPSGTFVETDFPKEFTVSVSDYGSFRYNLSGAIKEGLKRLDSIQFEPAVISVSGTVKCPGAIKEVAEAGVSVKAKLTIPKRFTISDNRVKDGVLTTENASIKYESGDAGVVSFKPVEFRVADFADPTGKYDFEDALKFENLYIHVPDIDAYSKVSGKAVTVELMMELKGGSSQTLVPEIVYGLVDRKSDPDSDFVEITGIPDYMRDAVLDLCNPMITVDVKTNSTIPLTVKSDFTSFSFEDDPAKASVTLTTEEWGDEPDDTLTSHFVIANYPPNWAGYIGVTSDIEALVQTLPDVLKVNLWPGTYIDANQHKVFVKYDTEVSMDYDFSIPLKFGPQMLMSFRDTISGMPKLLGDVMEKNDVFLVGPASSTLPVKLSYVINMLDENGKNLEITSTEGTIYGTDDPDTPVQSECKVKVEKSAAAKKISKMEIVFFMTEGNTQCLNEDHWIQMDIQVSVPGGIDIDLE